MTSVLDMMSVELRGIVCVRAANARGGWLFRCSCGAEFTASASRILWPDGSQKRTSCGCFPDRWKNGKKNITHGLSKTYPRLYDIHFQMIRRCSDPSCADFKWYGAKGVSVCAEWLEVAAFVDWALANGYRPGLSLDRRDGAGNYGPGNCRWATPLQQVRNRSNTAVLTACGQTRPVAEWAELTGIPYSTIRGRIRRGLQGSDALIGYRP